jgi:hypothetical protein
MKMEMQVCAASGGTVHSVLCEELSPVAQGQHLFIIETASGKFGDVQSAASRNR